MLLCAHSADEASHVLEVLIEEFEEVGLQVDYKKTKRLTTEGHHAQTIVLVNGRQIWARCMPQMAWSNAK